MRNRSRLKQQFMTVPSGMDPLFGADLGIKGVDEVKLAPTAATKRGLGHRPLISQVRWRNSKFRQGV
jgi:hypothetical protein